MASEQQDKFQRDYTLGKAALERGDYRESVEYLKSACEQVARGTRQGGEAAIWLVTAYQAANDISEAIALCKQLTQHPFPDIRKQAKRLLYILQAPALKRPKEWLTEMPDFSALPESDLAFRRGSGTRRMEPKPQNPEPEDIDLTQVNTEDNKFIWIALIAILAVLGSLFWLG